MAMSTGTLFQSVQVMKDKERTRNCHSLKDTKATGQLNAMWDPGLDMEQKMDLSRKMVTGLKPVV